ncbi:uncharacterized protein LOC114321980 [Camellia sinensis]|uniref:uncharacterized protein LOC114321980 n=1 Tax=Camellia sinensis TaxID=4442 RepID=UPI001035A6AE|nr:uncharacterized protein LOC114321980 [Camellia sinensis]
MKPPTFHGGADPLKAEAWVLGIEKLFEVFPCLEAQKVQLTTFTLEDETRKWWMLIRENNKGIDWARFLEIFYDKYFPQCARDRKVIEFKGLKQGNLTVVGYEAKFTELTKFAPHMVDTDYKKALMSKTNMANQSKPLIDWKSKRHASSQRKDHRKSKIQDLQALQAPPEIRHQYITSVVRNIMGFVTVSLGLASNVVKWDI